MRGGPYMHVTVCIYVTLATPTKTLHADPSHIIFLPNIEKFFPPPTPIEREIR